MIQTRVHWTRQVHRAEQEREIRACGPRPWSLCKQLMISPLHAMALRELLTSAPASWNCRKVAFQIKTLFATTEADDDPRVRLDEPDDDMTGVPVLFRVVEHMGLSGGRLARMNKEEKV